MTEIESPRTRRQGFWRATVALQSIMLVAALLLPGGALAGPSPTGATIASDKADYAPGETVTLTGAGWASGEAVAITVDDAIGQSWQYTATVTASDTGVFVDAFVLPNYFISNYNVTATGPDFGTATTSFTDLSIGTYDQCANDLGDGYTTGNLGCRWINGNLNHNNSSYPENTATVQRLWLTGFEPGSVHNIYLNYGTTKAGKHAYDFLTTWSFSENWITDADRCENITGCTGASDTTLTIPLDSTATAPGPVQLGGGQLFTMRGGSMGSATNNGVVSGSYAADSDTQVVITFTVDASGSLCSTSGPTAGTCGVVLWFGAHVAWQANWGAGTGAGNIPGSPYHVSLVQLDSASIGSRDNQMQASAVTGTEILTISKAVTGGPSSYPQTDFTVHVNCLDPRGSKQQDGFPQDLKIGYPVTGSVEVTGIPLPSTCTVTEPSLPSAPAGYVWGTPVITGSPVTLPDAEGNTSAAVTVTNNLTENTGGLVLSKVFTDSGYAGNFTIHYDCSDGTAHDGDVTLAAGASTTITGIPRARSAR